MQKMALKFYPIYLIHCYFVFFGQGGEYISLLNAFTSFGGTGNSNTIQINNLTSILGSLNKFKNK